MPSNKYNDNDQNKGKNANINVEMEDDENNVEESNDGNGYRASNRLDRKIVNGIKDTANNIKDVIYGSGVKRWSAILKLVVKASIYLLLFLFLIVLIVEILTSTVAEAASDAITSHFDTNYVNGDEEKAKIKSLYDTTGSLLLATNADMAEISEEYSETLKKYSDTIYNALTEDGKVGNHKLTGSLKEKDIGYIDNFDINNACDFIINAEKFNFNRVTWQKYSRGSSEAKELTLQNKGLKKDDNTGLLYPDDSDAEKDIVYFAKLLAPYMQNALVPSSLITGMLSSTLDEKIGNFAFQVVDKGYHKITVTAYELRSVTLKAVSSQTKIIFDNGTLGGVTSSTIYSVEEGPTTYTTYIITDGQLFNSYIKRDIFVEEYDDAEPESYIGKTIPDLFTDEPFDSNYGCEISEKVEVTTTASRIYYGIRSGCKW